MSKEKILEEYRKKFGLCDGSLKYCGCKKELDFISKAIDQTREETIKEIEESLPKAKKINKRDHLGLDYTLRDVKYEEHNYRIRVLNILNKLKN